MDKKFALKVQFNKYIKLFKSAHVQEVAGLRQR